MHVGDVDRVDLLELRGAVRRERLADEGAAVHVP
jgi:hypothetical protein